MKIKVWDMPTRIFHWSLVSAFIVVLMASQTESNLETHVTAGYVVLGLTFFRILWGFSGNKFARFSDFLKGLRQTHSYLRQFINLKPPSYAGHNPLVGWIVILMFGMMVVIALTGIIVYSGEENKGLFAGLFSFTFAQYAHNIHIILANTLIWIIVIHFTAALVHEFYFKEKIITSMVTGNKNLSVSLKEDLENKKPADQNQILKFIALIFLVLIGGWALTSSTLEGERGIATAQAVTILNNQGIPMDFKSDKKWQAECADSCHDAFHPTLLPAKSWERIMANLENHFDEDASLDEDTKDEILSFLVKNSAEYSTTEASKKILWFLVKDDLPLRVTETPYWRRKHAGINKGTFNRQGIFSNTNCAACHMDAEQGLFEDANIKIPKSEKRGAEL